MNKLQIGDLEISDSSSTVVIAEIGINHGGSLDTAKAMVDSAARAGARVIKHQTHIPSEEMSDHARSTIPGNSDQSIFDIISDCSLSLEDETLLKHYVEQLGITYLSTPFSRAAADFLFDLDVPAFKIGSGECNNLPLIRHIARFRKPVILSTGMNDLDSVKASVNVLREARTPFALLHCVNLYPTPPHLSNLGAITDLRTAFPDTQIGFSDHAIGNYASFAAVALGANVIEKHFTDSYERAGPDIECSVDEHDLADLIYGCNVVRLARAGTKHLLPEEEVTRTFAYSSVVCTKRILRGDIFTEDNIWVKRPGTGEIPAKDYDQVLGAKATRNIESGEQLRRSDYA